MTHVQDDSFDTTDEVKEVYAVFGLAIYAAQCLEHGLVNALVYLQLYSGNGSRPQSADEWSALVDGVYDEEFQKTLGQAVSAFQRQGDVTEALIAKLSEALEILNRLSHRYFRERSEDFMFSAGRQLMISELHGFVSKLRAADSELDAYLEPIRERFHITDEQLAITEAQMLDRKAAEYSNKSRGSSQTMNL